jgi:hypothetical protein
MLDSHWRRLRGAGCVRDYCRGGDLGLRIAALGNVMIWPVFVSRDIRFLAFGGTYSSPDERTP